MVLCTRSFPYYIAGRPAGAPCGHECGTHRGRHWNGGQGRRHAMLLPRGRVLIRRLLRLRPRFFAHAQSKGRRAHSRRDHWPHCTAYAVATVALLVVGLGYSLSVKLLALTPLACLRTVGGQGCDGAPPDDKAQDAAVLSVRTGMPAYHGGSEMCATCGCEICEMT